jgi:hypothetical protein
VRQGWEVIPRRGALSDLGFGIVVAGVVEVNGIAPLFVYLLLCCFSVFVTRV